MTHTPITLADLMRDAPTGCMFDVIDVPHAQEMRLYDAVCDREMVGPAKFVARVMPADWPMQDKVLHGIHSKERRADGCFVVTCWEPYISDAERVAQLQAESIA